MTVEELAARIDAEAARRRPEVFFERVVASLDDDPLEAFIGIGASGKSEPFDIHVARAEAAEAKFARGV